MAAEAWLTFATEKDFMLLNSAFNEA